MTQLVKSYVHLLPPLTPMPLSTFHAMCVGLMDNDDDDDLILKDHSTNLSNLIAPVLVYLNDNNITIIKRANKTLQQGQAAQLGRQSSQQRVQVSLLNVRRLFVYISWYGNHSYTAQ